MTTIPTVPADDFSTMDDDALAAAVSTLAAHIHAATYRLLALIAELDRRDVWDAQGPTSAVHRTTPHIPSPRLPPPTVQDNICCSPPILQPTG